MRSPKNFQYFGKSLFISLSHQTLIILIVDKWISNLTQPENINRIHPRLTVQNPPPLLVTVKKVLEKKVLIFRPKKFLWEKVLLLSPEIKSYQFETLFYRTFFLAQVSFYIKKSSEKKSFNKWKCMIDLQWKKSLGYKHPINNRRFLVVHYSL